MTFYVLGNWKSNGSLHSIGEYAVSFSHLIGAVHEDLVLGLSLPFHLIDKFEQYNQIWVGAQDVSIHGPGAYTGEIHAEMLRELNCQFCLVGHSERRQLFGETIEATTAKLARLLEHERFPVLCIGETLAEREAGQLERVLDDQLSPLADLPAGTKLAVAYEPVWAIGTGVAAQPSDAQAAHAFILKRLADYGHDQTPVLYGGSVKPTNAAELASLSEIHGFLVGGASLTPKPFSQIAKAFRDAKNLC